MVQEHRAGDATHWDLMLVRPQEGCESSLTVWQVSVPPTLSNLNAPCEVRSIFDHPLRFLTYEGPLRQGRGTCRIFDRGYYDLLFCSQTLWVAEFRGKTLVGTFRLESTARDRVWILAKADPAGYTTGRKISVGPSHLDSLCRVGEKAQQNDRDRRS